MSPCKKCRAYVKREIIIKVKDGTVYVMKDYHNILYVYPDRPCSRCGLLLRDVPGVMVVA